MGLDVEFFDGGSQAQWPLEPPTTTRGQQKQYPVESLAAKLREALERR